MYGKVLYMYYDYYMYFEIIICNGYLYTGACYMVSNGKTNMLFPTHIHPVGPETNNGAVHSQPVRK